MTKMAVREGLAKPAQSPKTAGAKEKEDGIRKSQKILLTWLVSDERMFRQIKDYISPEDFSDGIYRKAAELLFQQYQDGEINPARIMNHFTDEEEHREVAALFHTRIEELTSEREKERL